MIEEQQCDVECRDKYGSTPLHSAALGGRLNIVQYLISEKGCDLMSRGRYGRTPLHGACQTGSLDIVKYLMGNVHPVSSLPFRFQDYEGHTSARNYSNNCYLPRWYEHDMYQEQVGEMFEFYTFNCCYLPRWYEHDMYQEQAGEMFEFYTFRDEYYPLPCFSHSHSVPTFFLFYSLSQW